MTDDLDLDALAEQLADFAPPEKKSGRGPREERIIAGFEDIQRFYQTHGRAPLHGEDRDIFERLYAVRLDQLRKLPEAQTLLAGLDSHGLLSGSADAAVNVDDLDEDALLAELGIGSESVDQDDITVLRHVRSSAAIRAAEEIVANQALWQEREHRGRGLLHFERTHCLCRRGGRHLQDAKCGDEWALARHLLQ